MLHRLRDNLARVRERINAACLRVGRDPAEIRLIAVTKYVSIEAIHGMLELGVRDIGESRAQELVRRAQAIHEAFGGNTGKDEPRQPRWHMIGSLQRNKVKSLLPFVDLIHSVDSLRLAEEIDAHATKLGRPIPILLQINASGESSKHGVAVGAASHLAEQLTTLKHLELRGLMTMAPLTDNQSAVRRTFERTRELFEEIVAERMGGPAFRELSMGMSSDFEAAILEGSTCVRIGSALFEGLENEAVHPPDGVEEQAAHDG
ncbi:MAG: YggS family pyridoxal phosphate-dependent enzyme [Phycisphaerae bacterium]|nr:YggS family pyridoxal phosphate-dependent enzyme [Phycisphaerae bacterium]